MTEKKRVKARTKEQMKEISDIVRNAESDEAALAFLKETLEDDFPELELGTMDLHEASEVLMQSESAEKAGSGELSGDLGALFGNFMKKSKSESKPSSPKKAGRKRRRSRRRKRR